MLKSIPAVTPFKVMLKCTTVFEIITKAIMLHTRKQLTSCGLVNFVYGIFLNINVTCIIRHNFTLVYVVLKGINTVLLDVIHNDSVPNLIVSAT